MTFPIFILIFWLVLSSCSSTDQNAENKEEEFTNSIISLVDSFDRDTSTFLNDKFPDSVSAVLYSTNNQLVQFITDSYSDVMKNDTLFSLGMLHNNLIEQGHTLDSSNDRFVFFKKSFNKREILEYQDKGESLLFFVGTQVWHSSKKYQLIWAWEVPKIKTLSVNRLGKMPADEISLSF